LDLDFAESFQVNSVTLKGHVIPITIESISEYKILPNIGDDLNKRDHYFSLVNRFHPTNEPKAKIYTTRGHVQGVRGVSFSKNGP